MTNSHQDREERLNAIEKEAEEVCRVLKNTSDDQEADRFYENETILYLTSELRKSWKREEVAKQALRFYSNHENCSRRTRKTGR